MKPLFRTRNRGRTGTGITAHRILSPACLPIPPSEPLSFGKDDANVVILFNSAKSYYQYTQLSGLPYLAQTTRWSRRGETMSSGVWHSVASYA